VDLHDAGPGLLVGVGELDLPVKTTRPQKCRVKNIDSVGGRNDLGTQDSSGVYQRGRRVAGTSRRDHCFVLTLMSSLGWNPSS
jgi:hypothetical protein